MFVRLLVTFVAFVNIALALGSVLEKDSCGCHKICDEKYLTKEKPDIKLRNACRSGCRLFHLIVRVPHKIAPPEAVKLAEENCASSCSLSFALGKQQEACITGCQNGCEFIVSVQPRVKLTIVVEDEINAGPDASELEQVLTDPALRQQLVSSLGSEKTKIPASYFTKLPIVRDNSHGCGPEPHLCESWLASEPLLCIAILLIVIVLMTTVYRRRGGPNEAIDYSCPVHPAPLLPEKKPLMLPV